MEKTYFKECTCKDPDIFEDENGINFCTECKVEVEVIRLNPKQTKE